MKRKNIIDLTRMKPHETAKVVEIQGGSNMVNKIQCMGLRQGKKIRKVSSHFWRGPQTIEIDNMQVAIGFGIAKRIFVEVER